MKILLVEDDADMCKALTRALEKRGFQVTPCGDGTAALKLIREETCDLVILDLNIPGLDGLHILQRSRAQGIATPVIVLTARGAVGDRVAGLNAGADDYLAKPFDLEELEARIRALIRRERRQVSTEVYQVADLILDTGSLRATRASRELSLSPIALRLLGILMRESPRVVTRRDIEREIWGDELPESDTLRSHLYNLRKAVDRSFDKQLLHTVQTAGYRIVDLDEQPKV